MSLFSYFRSSHKKTASTARERLQIVIAHERTQRNAPEYLPRLQQELLEVIQRYVMVDQDDVKVQVERSGDYEVLELNITLPDR